VLSAPVVIASWTRRHWLTVVGGAAATVLLIGIPTDVVPNPVFGRPVPVTWWSYPVLAVTAVLSGLLLATYVRERSPGEPAPGGRR
jgi:multidrug efflux pump subunit AcrA (membrane-fusion protein)